ncbi:MAG: hypothetical protein ACI39T_01525, partial [Candidatus Cryptobacteroides sp.]
QLLSEIGSDRSQPKSGKYTVSMRKAHFMDKHPIRTSASMIKAHFMDGHPIRSLVSMIKAHFMV